MQAHGGRDTAVLGFVAMGLAVLVGCVGATRLTRDIDLFTGPSVGDHVALAAGAPGPDWSAKARLPSGATCDIGMGAEAGAGGDLYVVTREASGDVEAIWSSKGRSSAAGQDCGNGAEVSLDRQSFSSLASGAFGLNPMAASDYPLVF